MGIINCSINDELDKKFRQKVNEIYGNKKGNISMAVESAIRDWLKSRGVSSETLLLRELAFDIKNDNDEAQYIIDMMEENKDAEGLLEFATKSSIGKLRRRVLILAKKIMLERSNDKKE